VLLVVPVEHLLLNALMFLPHVFMVLFAALLDMHAHVHAMVVDVNKLFVHVLHAYSNASSN